MEHKPKLNIPLKPFDKIIESASLLLMIVLWSFTLFSYFELPEIIPIHFDIAGTINKWGNKITLIFLPVTATIIFIGLSLLNKHPEVFNYPEPITDLNARVYYSLATRMLRVLKFALSLIFVLVSVFAYFAALRLTDKWGPWLLPTILLIIFAPVIYFILKMLKLKSGNKTAH